MKLLERYLLQIERYLPRKDKAEVSDELRSLFLDQLEDYDDTDQTKEDRLKDMIIEFGSPLQVAMKYRNDKPIILRELEPFLFMVFKIISISVPSALLFVTALGVYSDNIDVSTGFLVLELLKAIPSIFMALVTALGIVFLIFAGLSRALDPNKIEDDFHPDYLPPIPVDVYKVSMFEAIIGTAGGLVFLYVFNYQPGLIAVYYDNVREPLLNSNFDKILPFLNVSVSLTMLLQGYYLFKQSKSKLTITFEAVLQVFSGIILILLSQADIFNDIIINGFNIEIIPTLFKIGMIVGAVAAFIGAIVKIVKVFLAKEKR